MTLDELLDRDVPLPGDRLRFCWPDETKVGEVVAVHPFRHPCAPVFTVDFGDGSCATSNLGDDRWECVDECGCEPDWEGD